MRTFWELGYRATSMEDLEKASRLHKQSLYGAFGDKHALFLQGLRLYRMQTLEQIRALTGRAKSPLDALTGLLRYALKPAASKGCPSGCLMANSALELGSKDREAAAEVRLLFRGMEQILGELLRRGQKQGQIATRFTSQAMARSLVNTLNGMRVAEKAGVPRAQIQETVKLALDAIRA